MQSGADTSFRKLSMGVIKHRLIVLLGAAGLFLGLPGWIPPASAEDDFFGSGLEEFTGLRHQDVHEVADEKLDTMRGRYAEFYFGFDPSSPSFDRSGELVVTGTIPSNGGSLVGQVTVRDALSSSAFQISTNLLRDSFNNTSGVVQLVQITGNSNVVYQNLTLDVAIFFGNSTADPNYTTFQRYVQGRGR
jgi:hypothetical protein